MSDRARILVSLFLLLLLSACDSTPSGDDGGSGIDSGPGTDGASGCNLCVGGGCAANEECAYEPQLDCMVCRSRDGASEGEACTGEEDCLAELTCQFDRCAVPCTNDAECTSSTVADQCFELPELSACMTARCDAITPEDCSGSDQGCRLIGYASDGAAASACTQVGTTAVGERCTRSDECGAGHVCADSDFDVMPECSRLCYLDNDTCTDGRSCFVLRASNGMNATLNGRGIGFCATTGGGGS